MFTEPSAHEVPADAPHEFELHDLVFGRTVTPVPNKNKIPVDGGLGFEYAEHCFIGDAIKLTLANGEKVAASDHKLHLISGLDLTYGQINGLAGDFYGTTDAISDGKNLQDQSARFVRAYKTLAEGGPRLPKEALEILKLLKTEVDAVNNALAHHMDPSVAYSQLPDLTKSFEWQTTGRPKGVPSYLNLAHNNWDHFGADAHTSYKAGHTAAIQRAVEGDLEGAYAMNAFADHFLEDSFSAGHLRTPRRLLHGSINLGADLCAKYMHDEDNAIGLSVKNLAGQSWTMYGDKRALDGADQDNKLICVDAVQASADEVYRAYQSKSAPSADQFLALTLVPTLESARAQTQILADLFTLDKKRRRELLKRRIRDYKGPWQWTYLTTAAECYTSGLWDYPITLDPKKILPWSSVAVVTSQTGQAQIFYQKPGGGIVQNERLEGSWTNQSSSDPLVKAALFSPLAALSFNVSDGKEVRLYYLNQQYILQEYILSKSKGVWYTGSLGSMNIQAAPNTSFAAVHHGRQGDGLYIRVYYQEPISRHIQELCHDGQHWSKGSLIPCTALYGTRLAATVSTEATAVEPRLRLYYQTNDLSIKDCRYESGEWVPGELNAPRAPGWTPISAFCSSSKAEPLHKTHVYWRDVSNDLVETVSSGDDRWGPVTKLEGTGQTAPGTQFAVASWSDDEHLRIYYQGSNDSILEACQDSPQTSWYEGDTVAHGIDAADE
ncbi:hypothetical protein EUX98_g2796 [Antrodiella citrinella]|uniref:Uncharacterized protein n=1 Tax=Antrodiella citrinella TaxID=2447956 RepID=A0A4S4MY39_9APHY|nr:hypothetical protein EUX98_g2796 [Antrodiella citrinella]